MKSGWEWKRKGRAEQQRTAGQLDGMFLLFMARNLVTRCTAFTPHTPLPPARGVLRLVLKPLQQHKPQLRQNGSGIFRAAWPCSLLATILLRKYPKGFTDGSLSRTSITMTQLGGSVQGQSTGGGRAKVPKNTPASGKPWEKGQARPDTGSSGMRHSLHQPSTENENKKRERTCTP